MPAVQLEVQEEHWAVQIYEAMVLRGVDPHDMKPNWEDGKGSHVMLAMPEAKVAIATDGDVYDKLLKDDWQVTVVPVGAFKSFASTARELNSVTTNYRVRTSGANMIKTGSEDEQRLLDGILRAHLPAPDRNFKIMRPDAPSQELTVPDFTWPRHRVAFFMDGLWWHQGRDSDIRKKIALGTASKDEIEEAERQQSVRATRDARNRSDMAVDGWTVLSCTDEDIANSRGVAEQVERIKRALRNARDRAAQGVSAEGVPTAHLDSDGRDDLDNLFAAR